MSHSTCPNCSQRLSVRGAPCPFCGNPVAAAADEPEGKAAVAARAAVLKFKAQYLLPAELCGLGLVLMFAGGGARLWGEVLYLAGMGWRILARLNAR